MGETLPLPYIYEEREGDGEEMNIEREMKMRGDEDGEERGWRGEEDGEGDEDGNEGDGV